MLKLYDHLQIREIKVNNEYSPTSQSRFVEYNNDSELKIDIDLINNFRSISKLSRIPAYRDYFSEFCHDLNIGDSDNVRWDLVLDENSNKNYVKMLLNEIKLSLSHLTTYHFYVYPKRLKLYEKFENLIDKNGNEIKPPTYCHESSTGRTSIKDGFNFLICSKEDRKLIRAKDNEKVLIEIDFKACEPNLYLRSKGIKIDSPDVYSFLAKELNLIVKDRETLKRGILSVLYGANNSTSQKLLGGSYKDLEKIKDFFQIKEFEDELRNVFEEEGCIFNMYGRPVYSNKSLINKWIQSSAVDFCNLAFLEFVNKNKVKACFTVHDSITVSCLKEDAEKIMNHEYLSESISKIKLPVEITHYS